MSEQRMAVIDVQVEIVDVNAMMTNLFGEQASSVAGRNIDHCDYRFRVKTGTSTRVMHKHASAAEIVALLEQLGS